MNMIINDFNLFTVSFADDQAILTQDLFDIECMLRRLYTQYSKQSLEVSLDKTEYFFIKSDARFQILVKDKSFVKQVYKSNYLRVVVDGKDMESQNIRFRVQQA